MPSSFSRDQILADFREVQRLRGMPMNARPEEVPEDRTTWLAYRRAIRDLEGRRIVAVGEGSTNLRH